MNSNSKKILFLQSTGPYSTSQAQEALDVILMASTFDQKISLAFLGDGVFLLKSKQDPTDIFAKNFSVTYKALALYGIKEVYVDADSLQQRGLTAQDLLIPVAIVKTKELSEIFHSQDAIMTF